jgi:hypothetical protein
VARHPAGERPLLGRSPPAAPPPRRVAPDRRGAVSRDRRCPGRSGLGQSLRREQSRRGTSGIGCPTPDLEGLRRLPSIGRRLPAAAWQSSRPRIPRIEMLGWSVVVLVEMSTCRSHRGARGLDSSRESGARRGLAGVFRHR